MERAKIDRDMKEREREKDTQRGTDRERNKGIEREEKRERLSFEGRIRVKNEHNFVECFFTVFILGFNLHVIQFRLDCIYV